MQVDILVTLSYGGICRGVGVIEIRGMTLNGLFCADVLRSLDLLPLTDFTYKYHPAYHALCSTLVYSNTLLCCLTEAYITIATHLYMPSYVAMQLHIIVSMAPCY